jgi:hypothetical protein
MKRQRMSKRLFHHDDVSQQGPAEPDVMALLKRMQQQLAFLEKKLDTLISQSQTRPSGERHFSKPFRASSHSHRYASGERDAGYGERRSERGRHFENRHDESNRGFSRTGKSYDDPRESESGREQRLENRHGGEQRGFTHKKKPFFNRRKNRR